MVFNDMKFSSLWNNSDFTILLPFISHKIHTILKSQDLGEKLSIELMYWIFAFLGLRINHLCFEKIVDYTFTSSIL